MAKRIPLSRRLLPDYTNGAVFYGIGAKKRWIHSVFHIFVVLGSILQAIPIYFDIL